MIIVCTVLAVLGIALIKSGGPDFEYLLKLSRTA